MPVHQSRTIAEHQQREHSRSGHCASTEGDWKDSELVDIRPNHTHLIFFRFVFKNQSSFLTEIKLFYKKMINCSWNKVVGVWKQRIIIFTVDGVIFTATRRQVTIGATAIRKDVFGAICR